MTHVWVLPGNDEFNKCGKVGRKMEVGPDFRRKLRTSFTW